MTVDRGRRFRERRDRSRNAQRHGGLALCDAAARRGIIDKAGIISMLMNTPNERLCLQ
jgi:hypothetical protein